MFSLHIIHYTYRKKCYWQKLIWLILLCLSVLFIAFCDINAILHESTITRERISLFLVLYVDFSWSLHNPGRITYQCLASGTREFGIFHENVHHRLKGDTKTDIVLCEQDGSLNRIRFYDPFCLVQKSKNLTSKECG